MDDIIVSFLDGQREKYKNETRTKTKNIKKNFIDYVWGVLSYLPAASN